MLDVSIWSAALGGLNGAPAEMSERTLREWYPLGLEGCWLVNRVFPDGPDEFNA